jgi:hypothetical protein
MRKIDTLTSLAFSMATSKGRYALLLGSGVSMSSGIPTGWAIVQDLVRQFAEMEGIEPEESLDWYREEYGDPNYSHLLENLFPSQEDRNQFLREQIEPTPAEREEGLKQPTDAHKAIAKLVARGYVQIIVTTNFDRLLEQALQAEGVQPNVIHNDDSAQGALPYVHTDCTILKIHGDYTDTRSLNTAGELEEYPERLATLLGRLFDEYGWVVCGWSGDWDHALRRALLSSPNRRFQMYWSHYGPLEGRAAEIVEQREARAIKIEGADAFFVGVSERVFALEKGYARHPLSKDELVARVKRFSAEKKHRIRLKDAIAEERERVRAATCADEFPWNAHVTSEEFEGRLGAFSEICAPLVEASAHGVRWAEDWAMRSWVDTIERLANRSMPTAAFKTKWRKFARYPALVVLYSTGIVCVANEDWWKLERLFSGPAVRGQGRHEVTCRPSYGLKVKGIMPKSLFDNMKYVPGSEHLFETLKDPVTEVVAPDKYEEAFNRFEFLLALDVEVHLGGRGPIGRFGYLHRGPLEWMQEMCGAYSGNGAPPMPMLEQGMFGGERVKLVEGAKRLEERLKQLSWG